MTLDTARDRAGWPVRPSDLAGRRVLVLGLGVTGQAVAEGLTLLGAQVSASDARPEAELAGAPERLRGAGVEVETGSHDRALTWIADADVIVPSPGIPPSAAPIRRAFELEAWVLPEVELAARLARAPILAVTGTNGKTTVTMMLGAILEADGRDVVACGNIGDPFLPAVIERPDVDAYAVEVSSFQLAFCETFRPRVAVWTNFAPDHLDWHGSTDAYRDAKARIAARQGPEDTFVYPGSQPELAALAPHGPRRLGFGAGPGAGRFGAWYEDGGAVATLPGGGAVALGSLDGLRARGLPFVEDGLAAAAAALAFGVSPDAVRVALEAFRPGAHRVEPVAEVGGVQFVNDSKASNPHAALTAVRGFDRVVLIAGGRNKGLDLGALREARDRLSGVVALGEAAGEVSDAFAGSGVPLREAPTMQEAVDAAYAMAHPGDVVLLSPACTSWDRYANYAERGDAFRAACRALTGDPGSP